MDGDSSMGSTDGFVTATGEPDIGRFFVGTEPNAQFDARASGDGGILTEMPAWRDYLGLKGVDVGTQMAKWRFQRLLELSQTYQAEREYVVPEGMPLAVWRDKYSRQKTDGSWQSWGERLREVVYGNFTLDRNTRFSDDEFKDTLDLALKGVLAFSGRHLQHGDADQINKNMELFTNCSTAIFCFTSFWLLLNGSGVGADYSCYTRRIDFCKHMPHVRLVLNGGAWDSGDEASGAHPDFSQAMSEFGGYFESLSDAKHKYPANSEQVRWFEVEDSREGWVQVIAALETAAWQEKHGDKMFIFDFSKVRKSGAPIAGQQNRPASGPLPLMRAIAKVANLKGIPGMAPWKQAMFIDHYLASCVALGGVRRAARMATKDWRDPDVFDFIGIKRGGKLWSANISVLADQTFWKEADDPRTHASRVLQAAAAAQYLDGTGEPGFINVDRMTCDKSGLDKLTGENYINPNSKLKLHPRTRDMMGKIIDYIKKMEHPFIVNPCGEIVLAIWGGYCVIGDICCAHATSRAELLTAAEMMPRALMRVNTMESLYTAEVARTNRIGVSLTGMHEMAAKLFGGINFYDLVNAFRMVSGRDRYHGASNEYIGERLEKAREFWHFIKAMRLRVEQSANAYADMLGLSRPHTYNTIKPSGTISKVMACTEGAHLPAVAYYMRWVQLPKTIGGEPNPKVAEMVAMGYPMKDISHQYHNHVVIGYPTKQPICDILGDQVVTAEDTTPAEQFEWLRLIEEFWFGSKEDGSPANNQVSYTMKYDPKQIDFRAYMEMLRNEQATVRCCSIMPIVDMTAYAYQPEEKITAEQYHIAMEKVRIAAQAQAVARVDEEIYDDEALNCEGGVCAVDLSINRDKRPNA